MYKIKTLNKISPSGLDCFDKQKYTCGDNIENPDGIMVRSENIHEYNLDDSVIAIARAGAGVNNIPIDTCTSKGIVVFNTPGANANAVKELVVASLLISSRKIIDSIEWAKTLKGNGDNVPKMVEKGKGAFAGPELMGKTLGIIGLGAIGILVANAAKELGMKVYGYDPFFTDQAAKKLLTGIKHVVTIDEVYEKSDYITIHVPYNQETKGIINKQSINKMRDGVRILNLARAELVNEDDIIDALRKGKVSTYVVDFPTDKVIEVDGVIAIPHLGASTPESEDNCAYMAAKQLIDYIENGNIKNSVNFPDVETARAGTPRVCVIHNNVPNILAQISSVFSQKGINIENLLNKSKREYAYSVLDVECDEVSKEIEDSIKSIQGVISVRVIK